MVRRIQKTLKLLASPISVAREGRSRRIQKTLKLYDVGVLGAGAAASSQKNPKDTETQ